jgi:hypothetical protein
MRPFKKIVSISRFCPFFLIIFLFLVSIAVAADKVVVIPLFDDDATDTTSKCICEGTLSIGERWCNNGDGTVTDMSTCLVWLQDASWGGSKAWRCDSSSLICDDDYDGANSRAGILRDGYGGLSDGSVIGDWRLPTMSEFAKITQGSENVSVATPRWFTGIQNNYYWTSTTNPASTNVARCLSPADGFQIWYVKETGYFVWPVRGGN